MMYKHVEGGGRGYIDLPNQLCVKLMGYISDNITHHWTTDKLPKNLIYLLSGE